jgi:DNA mismatch repair protein MutL
MSAENSSSGRIRVLPEQVFRKIAAGEVIDRPSAVVRELIDNALDAGATEVDCALRSGGLDEVRITDNGYGMNREELELCFLPHATSKIETAEDIYHISSLGFRGEALGSIAACTRMEVISRPSAPSSESASEESSRAHRLRIDFGEVEDIAPCRGKSGTTVTASKLFHTMPGRKKFLSSRRGESASCRASFLDKALPFPSVRFRLFSENALQLLLPPGTFTERVAAAYSRFFKPEDLFEISLRTDEFSFRLVAGDPAIFRKDRRYIQIFLNSRRIDEYALVQAVEYGFSEFLPGGRFPYGFLFVENDPSLVDFNIHPAKREVKIRNLSQIHSSVVDEIRKALRGGAARYFAGVERTELHVTGDPPPPREGPTPSSPPGGSGRSYGSPARPTSVRSPVTSRRHPPLPEEIRERPLGNAFGLEPADPPPSRWSSASEPETEERTSGVSFRYVGQIFGVFLLADMDRRLYFIDQHAAHERILFERYSGGSTGSQRLLFPAYFETTEEAGTSLLERATELEDIGVRVEPSHKGEDTEDSSDGSRRWMLSAVPSFLKDNESVVIEYLRGGIGGSGDLKRDLLAAAACKASIKDGELLDAVTATELIDQALRLEFPRCPHGRPIWYVLSRDDLFGLVGRKV